MGDGDARAGGLELQLALLHSSLTGGRYASLTEPFPEAFEAAPDDASGAAGTERRDFDALRSTVASLPPATAVLEQRSQLTAQQRQVVDWLDGLAELRPVGLEAAHTAQPGASPVAGTNAASHQFSVRDQRSAPRRERWGALAQEHGVERVYHGSAVENFHSILNNGLKNFSGTLGQRTGAAFGNGIYLSDSLQLAQNFAPVQSTAGRMWGGASYGGEISCVAVCEVLLHPDVRRPGVESRRTDMLGGKDVRVPEKYWVVENEEHVRVTGLLLFGAAASADQAELARLSKQKANSSSFWMIFFYCLVIGLIAFSNSNLGRSFWRWWGRR